MFRTIRFPMSLMMSLMSRVGTENGSSLQILFMSKFSTKRRNILKLSKLNPHESRIITINGNETMDI